MVVDESRLRATLYLNGAFSVKCHESCWSEYLLVAAPKKVLVVLGAYFECLSRVKPRYSDYKRPRRVGGHSTSRMVRCGKRRTAVPGTPMARKREIATEVVDAEENLEEFEEENDWGLRI